MTPYDGLKMFSRKKYFKSVIAIYVRVHTKSVRGLLLNKL